MKKARIKALRKPNIIWRINTKKMFSGNYFQQRSNKVTAKTPNTEDVMKRTAELGHVTT